MIVIAIIIQYGSRCNLYIDPNNQINQGDLIDECEKAF